MASASAANSFAILGAPPEFDQPLEGKQDYWPSWGQYEAAFRGIFSRQYYTNQGPLTARLEERLSTVFRVKHAVCVTNTTIALIMAAEAMGLQGRVIVPALASISVLQSLAWVSLKPIFCDVDPTTHQIDIDEVAARLKIDGGDIAAILAVNLWGNVCDAAALRHCANKYGVRLYFDSVHAFGNVVNGIPVGNVGDVEVFSLHAGRIMGGAEGGFLCTNDDILAARLRNIRSSYGAGPPVAVVKTSNGRMSEAQAALGLLHLDDFSRLQSSNQKLFHKYEIGLSGIPGLRLLKPRGMDSGNYAYVVCEIEERQFGLTRDRLLAVLIAENINARGYVCFDTVLGEERPYAFPRATQASHNSFQLPLGADVSEQAVERVCRRIGAAQAHAGEIRSVR